MTLIHQPRRFLFLTFAFLSMAAATDPWTAKESTTPAALAAALKPSLQILYVGFPVLYSGAHVPGARLAGPASKEEGLQSLDRAAADFRKDQPVYIYCGCCPFDKCPNIRPAYMHLKSAGFTDVRVVKMETNFHTDWVGPQYPTAKGTNP